MAMLLKLFKQLTLNGHYYLPAWTMACFGCFAAQNLTE